MEKYLILINISRLQYRKHSAKKIYICNQDEHFILTNKNYNNTQPINKSFTETIINICLTLPNFEPC